MAGITPESIKIKTLDTLGVEESSSPNFLGRFLQRTPIWGPSGEDYLGNGGIYAILPSRASRECIAPPSVGRPRGIHSREAVAGEYGVYISPISLGNPPQDGPHIGVLVGTSQESLGELDSRYQSFITWLLLTRVHVFFSEIVLQRNCFINQ